jgi:hypothetical protein
MRPNMILDWQFLLSSELRMAFLSDARLERGCSILFDVRQISVMHAEETKAGLLIEPSVSPSLVRPGYFLILRILRCH